VRPICGGNQSHGVCARLVPRPHRSGVMQPVTTPEFVVDAGTIAVIDGHDGVGQVLAMLATHEAITRARAHGIWRRSRCATPITSYLYDYTRRVAAAGCVAMLTK